MRSGIVRALGPVLMALGIATLALAVQLGGASVYVLGIFPVLAGTSPLLLAGAVLTLAGLFFLPLLFEGGGLPTGPAASPLARSPSPEAPLAGGGGGGLVLVGPVPIFFGGWAHPGRRRYWLALALGIVLFALAFLLFWLA